LIRFSPSLAKVLGTKRQSKVGEKVRVNLHHGKIEDAVVRAVIHDDDGI